MYAESGRTVIFSAVLLRMLMAYFLPRLLPDLEISPLVPFFTSGNLVRKAWMKWLFSMLPLAKLHTAKHFSNCHCLFCIKSNGVWLHTGMKAANLEKAPRVAYF